MMISYFCAVKGVGCVLQSGVRLLIISCFRQVNFNNYYHQITKNMSFGVKHTEYSMMREYHITVNMSNRVLTSIHLLSDSVLLSPDYTWQISYNQSFTAHSGFGCSVPLLLCN